MTMLKTTSAHDGVAQRIKKYLEVGTKGDQNRALAEDFVNMPRKDDQRNWGVVMDETREMFGLVGTYRGMKRRTFLHMIVSPDPRDGVDLDTLRKLATTYARELFGDEYGNDGIFGKAQVAIVYQDDNENNIPHAHLIVNRVDLNTGKALHFSNKDVTEEMPNRLQELSKELNLSFFDNDNVIIEEKPELNFDKEAEEKKMGKPFLTKVERALRREGKYTWKNDLRRRILTALSTTNNEKELVNELKKLDVEVRQTTPAGNGDADWIYAMGANPTRWQSSGYRLGKGYTRASVLKKQQEEVNSEGKKDTSLTTRTNKRIERREESLQELRRYTDKEMLELDPIKGEEDVPKARPIREIQSSRDIIREFNVEYKSDFDEYLKACDRAVIRYKDDPTKDELDISLINQFKARLTLAKEVNNECGWINKEQRPTTEQTDESREIGWIHDEGGTTHRGFIQEHTETKSQSRTR